MGFFTPGTIQWEVISPLNWQTSSDTHSSYRGVTANVLATIVHCIIQQTHQHQDRYKPAVVSLAGPSFTPPARRLVLSDRLVWGGLLERAACGFVWWGVRFNLTFLHLYIYKKNSFWWALHHHQSASCLQRFEAMMVEPGLEKMSWLNRSRSGKRGARAVFCVGRQLGLFCTTCSIYL